MLFTHDSHLVLDYIKKTCKLIIHTPIQQFRYLL